MITLNEVTKTYPLGKGSSVTAVYGANLEIDQGEFVLIVGRSGSGKTTLLKSGSGVDPANFREGTDRWDQPLGPDRPAAVLSAQSEDRICIPVPQPVAHTDGSRQCDPAHSFWLEAGHASNA